MNQKRRYRINHLTKLASWQQVVLAVLDPRLYGALSGSLTTKLLCELFLPLRGRALMNLVSLFQIFLRLVIHPFQSCASVESVLTILLPPSLGILIGQSAFLYSQPQSMYQPWV